MPPNDDAARRREGDRTVNLHHPDRHTSSTDFELVPDGPSSLGDYELLEEIGAGGMGRVWRARQRSRGRVVALKTLLPRYSAIPGLVQRFRKEAEAAGQLDHPGIVPVWGIDEADGQTFFTMPLVHGHGLDERLHQGPLDNRRAAFIVQRVAEAVAYAHRRNFIHRDLKPGNILVDRDGGVKVTDFGLARRLDERDLGALEEAVRAAHPETVGTVVRLTRAGAIMGTPGYMAPEQANSSEQAGTASDIWSLGAILYACLTGRPPFIGADVIETVTLTIEAEPVPPDEINPEADPGLIEICLRCLRKDPAERFASADDLAAELARWREGQEAPKVWELWRGRAARFLTRSPELVPLVTGLVVHRLDTIQAGLFTGCAVAGVGLAARRGVPGLPLLPLALVIAFFAALPIGGLSSVDPPWLAGLPAGVVGLLGLGITIGCGLAALDPDRPRGWPAQRIAALCVGLGTAALLVSVGAALAIVRLRDIDAGWTSTASAVEFQFGRVAGWLLAVPLGLATGALLGRLNQRLDQFGREPLPAFALGAAAMAVVAAFALRVLRPESPTMAARFTAAGPGPALSVADAMLADWVGGGPEARQVAAGGALYLKLLLLTAAMALGGVLVGWAARRPGGKA
jgi:serine/threonine protein kinase